MAERRFRFFLTAICRVVVGPDRRPLTKVVARLHRLFYAAFSRLAPE